MKCSIKDCNKEATGIAVDWTTRVQTYFCKEHFDELSIIKTDKFSMLVDREDLEDNLKKK